MRADRQLSKLERAVAIFLALIWVAAGLAALYLAVLRSRWVLSFCALIAIGYGLAWTRVAVRSHFLTWPRLLKPWRPEHKA
jgi:hypothetical protein